MVYTIPPPQPFMGRSQPLDGPAKLPPGAPGVSVDGPPFGLVRTQIWSWYANGKNVTWAFDLGRPTGTTSLQPQSTAAPPVVNNPPPVSLAWLAALPTWGAVDYRPAFQRPLSPAIPGMSVDIPPGIPPTSVWSWSGDAAIIPRQRQIIPLGPPPVVNNPPGMTGNLLASILSGWWKAPDPPPVQKGPLSPGIPGVSVDPPPFRQFVTRVWAWHRVGKLETFYFDIPAETLGLPPSAAIIPVVPPVVNNPPPSSSVWLVAAAQWAPITWGAQSARLINPGIPGVSVDPPPGLSPTSIWTWSGDDLLPPFPPKLIQGGIPPVVNNPPPSSLAATITVRARWDQEPFQLPPTSPPVPTSAPPPPPAPRAVSGARGWNLHALAVGYIGAINPQVSAGLQINVGNTIAADGTRAPTFSTPGAITASIDGYTLNVAAVAAGTLSAGQALSDLTGALAPGTLITGLGTGSGGPGTYTVNIEQAVAAEAMTTSLTVLAQVQPLTYRDIQQVDGLNLQGTRRAIYLNGFIDGLIRSSNKGGDLVTLPDGTVWLVAIVLEHWDSGWCKVAATLQNGG